VVSGRQVWDLSGGVANGGRRRAARRATALPCLDHELVQPAQRGITSPVPSPVLGTASLAQRRWLVQAGFPDIAERHEASQSCTRTSASPPARSATAPAQCAPDVLPVQRPVLIGLATMEVAECEDLDRGRRRRAVPHVAAVEHLDAVQPHLLHAVVLACAHMRRRRGSGTCGAQAALLCCFRHKKQ
jgi:hypothetical protein